MNQPIPPSRPAVGVGVAIFKGDDVLLIKRGKEPRKGQWSLPGGAQELGETTLEAAYREVGEETGLIVDIKEIVDVVNVIQKDESGEIAYHYVLVDYVAEYVSGTAIAMDDAVDAKWVSSSTISDTDLWSETIRIILKSKEILSHNG
ncbi:MAG: NUDIX hydrolase [Proteobacteria bacterium]|nr:NUDIX hydrolase [Pseudomonadota bacterium]